MGPALARLSATPTCSPCTLAGVELLLHPSGVAFHGATGTLVVADLHLEKGTAYAAQVAAEKAAETVKSLHGLGSVDAFVKGVGLGRDAAIRALGGFDITVDSIKDVTGVPHGGVRPKKARRA